ncbi:hypothetical protein FRB99_000016 [Tulasnella sp. 403]|nr:hypothetical protein FRB99_000016 [Tulasnella sp. 403]
MGQRHQVYAIARVQKYSICVAAFHHQWLYGYLAVETALAALRDIKRQARIIKKELRIMHDGAYKPIRGPIPLPFVWSVLRKHYGDHGISAKSHPVDQDNNDGITVIDVTNPNQPTACFINLGILTSEIDSLPVGEPSTAEQYMRHYYPAGHKITPEVPRTIRDGYEAFDELVRGFEEFPLTDRAVLADTWPRSIFGDGRIGDERQEYPDGVPLNDSCLGECMQRATEENPAFLQTLSEENLRISESGKKPDGYPESLIPLLVRAYEMIYERGALPRKELDLSGPKSWSPEQIIQVAAKFPEATSLDLSLNMNVTAATVEAIIRAREKPLKELFLFNVPGLRNEGGDSIDTLKANRVLKGVKVYYTDWLLESALAEVEGRTTYFPDGLFVAVQRPDGRTGIEFVSGAEYYRSRNTPDVKGKGKEKAPADSED